MPSIEEFEKLAHLSHMKDKEPVKKAQRSIEQLEHTAINAITTAFGFVIALTWVDTIRSLFDSFLISAGISGSGVSYQVFVALLITFFCVLGIVYLPKLVMQKQIEEAIEESRK
ncbi:MAG: DUF5654 family protein [archaeon]